MTVRQTPGHCPICGDDDQARRISAVLDSGTSSSRGGGSAIGIGTGLGLAGGVGSGSAVTTTALVERFHPDSRPGSLILAGFFLWFIVGLVTLLLTIGALGPTATSLVTAALVATAALVTARLSLGARWRRAREAWDRADAWIRGGYYCLRDDVCYEPGGTLTWPPEKYAAASVRT